MQSYEGIYENGVVRPLMPLTLPESTPVSIVVPTVPPSAETPANASSDNPPKPSESLTYSAEGLRNVYAILGERYASGHTDTAARHNEHQP